MKKSKFLKLPVGATVYDSANGQFGIVAEGLWYNSYFHDKKHFDRHVRYNVSKFKGKEWEKRFPEVDIKILTESCKFIQWDDGANSQIPLALHDLDEIVNIIDIPMVLLK